MPIWNFAGYKPSAMPTVFVESPVLSINLNAALTPFDDFAELPADAATAVVRSARLFQQALWIADSDPNFSWILLSSIETAANFWRRAVEAPAESFAAWKPHLANRLVEAGGPTLLKEVASELVGVTRATKKFIDFFWSRAGTAS